MPKVGNYEKGFRMHALKHDGKDSTAPISVLGEGCHFEGGVSFTGEARIGGSIIGDLTSKSILVMEKTSSIKGKIIGNDILLEGKLEGDLIALNFLRITSTAIIDGNLHVKRLVVEDGAKISGKVNYITDTDDVQSLLSSHSDLQLEGSGGLH